MGISLAATLKPTQRDNVLYTDANTGSAGGHLVHAARTISLSVMRHFQSHHPFF